MIRWILGTNILVSRFTNRSFPLSIPLLGPTYHSILPIAVRTMKVNDAIARVSDIPFRAWSVLTDPPKLKTEKDFHLTIMNTISPIS